MYRLAFSLAVYILFNICAHAQKLDLIEKNTLQLDEIDFFDSRMSKLSNGTYQIIPKTEIKVSDILENLGLPNSYEFRLERTTISRLNSENIYKKYSGYYHGTKVANSSIILELNKESGNIVKVISNIKNNININGKPKHNIHSIQAEQCKSCIRKASYEISDMYTDGFRLCWKLYDACDEEEIIIDDNDGEVLTKYRLHTCGLYANVPYYSTSTNLNDSFDGTYTQMVTPENDIIIYDGLDADRGHNFNISQWTSNFIPKTMNTQNWMSDASDLAKGSFFVTNWIKPKFHEIGIDFGTVHIATAGIGAWACFQGLNNAYIKVGVTDTGVELCTHDIISHELAHEWIYDLYLGYTSTSGNKALHEGIGDITGTYIESKVQSSEWIIGDDAGLNLRDLSELVTLNDVENGSNNQHERGRVIGHWYYALSEGIPEDGISALGMDLAFDILVDGLNGLPSRSSGYSQIRNSTLDAVLNEFGLCSEEYMSVIRAWDRVKVFTGADEVCYCMENDLEEPHIFQFSAQNLCPEPSVFLDQYAGSPPEEGIDVVWSTDDNPDDGLDDLYEDYALQTNVYYGYFRHLESGCLSPSSNPISIQITCCNNTEDIIVKSQETLMIEQPTSVSGNVIIEAGGALYLKSTLVMGKNSELIIENFGRLRFFNGSIITKCPDEDSWLGIRSSAQSRITCLGGKIMYAQNGITGQIGTVQINDMTIEGPNGDGFGLKLENLDQVFDLSNITISNYDVAIDISNTEEYLEFESGNLTQVNTGIKFYNTSGSISDYTIHANRNGIMTYLSSGTMLSSNTILSGLQENSGFPSITYGVFSNYSDNLIIQDNQIGSSVLPTSTGVYNYFGNNVEIINRNIIYSKDRGIQSFAGNISIQGNDITNQHFSSGPIYVSLAENCDISNNYLKARGSVYGIEINSCQNAMILHNDLECVTAAGNNRVAAIRSIASNNSIIEANYIDNPFGPTAGGILTSNSSGNIYECNYIQCDEEGIGIYFNSMGQEIKANDIDVSGNGNDLEIRSIIGLQFAEQEQLTFGNAFRGGNTDASTLSIPEVLGSRFLVNPSIPYHLPSNPNPNIWFDDKNWDFENCEGVVQGPDWDPFWGNEEMLCKYYEDVLHKFGYASPEYIRMMLTIKRHALFKEGFTYFDCLENALPIECLDTLLSVEYQIFELLNSKDSTRTDSIRLLLNEFSNSQSEENKENLSSIISSERKKAIKRNDDFKNRLNDMKEDVEKVECDSLIIHTIKKIMLAYIDYLQAENKNEYDYTNLINYSKLCADDYGHFVNIARSIMANVSDEYFDNYDTCRDKETDYRVFELNDFSSAKLFPNPSNGLISVNFENPESGNLIIFSSAGEKILERSFYQESTMRFNLSGQNGLIFIKVDYSDGRNDIFKTTILVN